MTTTSPWGDLAAMKDNPPIDLTPNDVVEILMCLDELNMADALFWRAHNGIVHFYIDCSDRFAWGSADGETLSPATLPTLRQAYKDLAAIGGGEVSHTDLLYCARMRQFRPQHACYPKNPQTWPLFDACGPARTAGLGNPAQHPSTGMTSPEDAL